VACPLIYNLASVCVSVRLNQLGFYVADVSGDRSMNELIRYDPGDIFVKLRLGYFKLQKDGPIAIR
jgi:hypothetical protein